MLSLSHKFSVFVSQIVCRHGLIDASGGSRILSSGRHKGVSTWCLAPQRWHFSLKLCILLNFRGVFYIASHIVCSLFQHSFYVYVSPNTNLAVLLTACRCVVLICVLVV